MTSFLIQVTLSNLFSFTEKCFPFLKTAVSFSSTVAGMEYDASNTSLKLFSARSGHSYSCRSQSVYMGNGLYLDVTQAQMQALDLQNGNFGKRKYCCQKTCLLSCVCYRSRFVLITCSNHCFTELLHFLF